MKRVILTMALILRVWWGEGPTANGIFVRRITVMNHGRAESFFVVKNGESLSIVAEADIIKTEATEE